jgi:hypothetical protein
MSLVISQRAALLFIVVFCCTSVGVFELQLPSMGIQQQQQLMGPGRIFKLLE